MSRDQGAPTLDLLVGIAAHVARMSAGPPRISLRIEEAAASLSVSHDYFSKNIAPELRIVRKGRVRLVPISELESWLQREAAYALDSPSQ